MEIDYEIECEIEYEIRQEFNVKSSRNCMLN